MTTYKNIKGIEIKYLSADPPAPTVGQVWYNSTTKVVKGAINGGAAAGTWSSGGNLNTTRNGIGGIGIQTAAVAVAGQTDSTTIVSATEEYNGTSWTEVTNIPAVNKYMASGGVQTAGWIALGNSEFDGDPPFPNTFHLYDGTNWSTGSSTNTGRYGATGAGTQTACFVSAGAPPVGGLTEIFDGSSWTEVADLNTVRLNGYSSGNSTAGLTVGGSPGSKANSETWNGSSWTEGNDLNTGRSILGQGGGTATISSSLVAGGYNGSANLVNTEFYNGTSWTEVNDLATAVGSSGYATSGGSSALNFGGWNPPTSFKNATEEFTAPEFVTKTFDVS